MVPSQFKIKLAIIYPILFVTLLGCHSTLRAEDLWTIDYFAGKNEICSDSKLRELRGTLKRLILVVDHYGDSDREIYCTLVTLSNEKGKNVERRFSASKQPCLKLLNSPQTNKFHILVTKDHLCKLVAPSMEGE